MDSVSIPRSTLLSIIEGMENAISYTKEMTYDDDHGYPFSYGYLQAQSTHLTQLLRALTSSN